MNVAKNLEEEKNRARFHQKTIPQVTFFFKKKREMKAYSYCQIPPSRNIYMLKLTHKQSTRINCLLAL